MTNVPEIEGRLIDRPLDAELDFEALIDFDSALDFVTAVKSSEEAIPKSQPVRRTFQPTLLKERAVAEKALQGWVENELAIKLARTPEFAHADLRHNIKVAVRIKATPQSGNVLRALLQRILSANGAAETQVAIREYVQLQHQAHNVYKDWTKPLPAWAIIQAQKQVLGSGLPFNQVKIKSKMSLRDIHAAAKDALIRSKGGTQTYSAEISISDDSLVINGLVFKITKNRSGGKEYSIARLNVDSLRMALVK